MAGVCVCVCVMLHVYTDGAYDTVRVSACVLSVGEKALAQRQNIVTTSSGLLIREPLGNNDSLLVNHLMMPDCDTSWSDHCGHQNVTRHAVSNCSVCVCVCVLLKNISGSN